MYFSLFMVVQRSLNTDGEIGEYIVQARRSGNDWFVGAMTHTEARTITLTTDFLEPGKKYMLHLYEDDDKLNTLTKVRSTHKKIKAGDKLVLKLKASGGTALHFIPLKQASLCFFLGTDNADYTVALCNHHF